MIQKNTLSNQYRNAQADFVRDEIIGFLYQQLDDFNDMYDDVLYTLKNGTDNEQPGSDGFKENLPQPPDDETSMEVDTAIQNDIEFSINKDGNLVIFPDQEVLPEGEKKIKELNTSILFAGELINNNKRKRDDEGDFVSKKPHTGGNPFDENDNVMFEILTFFVFSFYEEIQNNITFDEGKLNECINSIIDYNEVLRNVTDISALYKGIMDTIKELYDKKTENRACGFEAERCIVEAPVEITVGSGGKHKFMDTKMLLYKKFVRRFLKKK